MTNTYNLISSNNQWAKDFSDANPDFFHNSAKGQNPHVRLSQSRALLANNISDALDWVCRLKSPRVCCDWRSAWRDVRPQEYCKVSLIESAFEVAYLWCSQFHSDDTNLLSVLSYAVEHLHIRDGAFFSSRLVHSLHFP